MALAGSTDPATLARYAAWFHELDAWTEYWDVYHPETRGRFYFGDGQGEAGLLGKFLPRGRKPPPFAEWTRMALAAGPADRFLAEVRKPDVAAAISEVDALTGRLFQAHFGDASRPEVRRDYLEATFLFAVDDLPPAPERFERISAADPRKATAGRHTLDGDLMWFAWALELEAAEALCAADGDGARRALFMAGVAMGCGANFAWRGHRRTRAEYHPDDATRGLLLRRATAWTADFDAGAAEVRALYRIREWGEA